MLCTENLNQDIAFTIICNSDKDKLVGLRRNLNSEQMTEFFNEINIQQLKDSKKTGAIRVRVIGGDNSEASKEAAKNLFAQLDKIDHDHNIINIVGWDVNNKIHPNSFMVSCYHGGIYAMK